jgi:DNA helicase HerA-like ATPase
MAEPLLIAKSDKEIHLLPRMANRHGLIAGATGTGKTVTLQVLGEHFSAIGVPVFMADVKGDFSGISQPGKSNPKIAERVATLGLKDFRFTAFPVTFWDIFGEQGHPIRATLSEMGPLLLSRILNLNDTQEGVLNIAFRIADEHELLLLDLKDLRALLQHIGENASAFTSEYGNISGASVGAIQRNLLTLEQQGADRFFGEPALNLADFLQTDDQGRGIINVLAADKLLQSPRLYATFLLWLLSELFEMLPEVGDRETPKMVFFFDEAHLLFDDAPQALLERIEQVVRLIRSKGVGVYFCTQNPIDVPETVLGQLGNRVQHALRAYTPRDQKAVKAAATTFRSNPKLDVETVITELGTGEALVSFLDEKGRPGVVERALILPPQSQIGPITDEQRAALIKKSLVAGQYDQALDRASAYETLKGKAGGETADASAASAAGSGGLGGMFGGVLDSLGLGKGSGGAAPAPPSTGPRVPRGKAQPQARRSDSLVETVAKSTARTVGSTIGREIVRGVLGSILGGAASRRRR